MNKTRVLIIKTNADPLSDYEFVEPIRTILKKNNVNYVESDYKNLDKTKINESDRIIISGTALADFDYLEYINHFSFLRHNKKPVLGICAGMQIIAKVLNIPLINTKEIGVKRIKLFGEINKVYLIHNKSLSFEETKKEFEVIAFTKVNGVKVPQAIINKEKHIIGTQFHPEVFNKKLIERFISSGTIQKQ